MSRDLPAGSTLLGDVEFSYAHAVFTLAGFAFDMSHYHARTQTQGAYTWDGKNCYLGYDSSRRSWFVRDIDPSYSVNRTENNLKFDAAFKLAVKIGEGDPL